jgi:RsiW-degrading membrane proteinase PrsW (M82 family)
VSRVRTVAASEALLLVGLFGAVIAAWLIEKGFGLSAPLPLGRAATAAFAAAPAALWLAYFLNQDRRERAPKRHVVATYLAGAFVAGPLARYVLGIVLVTHPAAGVDLDPLSAANLVRAFAVIGVVEVSAIYAVVRYGVYRSSELDEPVDGLIYATAAALGYASHLTYVELGAGHGAAFLSIGATRAIVTALAHACFAAVIGYALGMAKFSTASPLRRAARLGAGLAVAVVLDGQFVVISGALAARGLGATPWRTVAYGFGFAAAVFVAVSPLLRRLVARPFAGEAGAADPEAA